MSPRRREILILGAAGVLAAAAGMLVGPLVRQSASGAASLQNAVFQDLEGRPRQLSEWRGRGVVCNFWATWCAPCREEMPMLADLHRIWFASGWEIVGIGIDQADKMREFATSMGIPYTLLQGDAATLSLLKELGNSAGALPYTVVLDRRGSIHARHLGVYPRAELEAVVRRAA